MLTSERVVVQLEDCKIGIAQPLLRQGAAQHVAAGVKQLQLLDARNSCRVSIILE